MNLSFGSPMKTISSGYFTQMAVAAARRQPFYSEGGTDFSSGLFEDNSLVVEGRPRDGGLP